MKRSASRSANLSSVKKKKQGDNGFVKFLPLICLIFCIGGFVGYYIYLITQGGDQPPTTPIVSPTEALSPKKATIYLDNSTSMKGYASGGQTDYIDALSDLVSIYPNTNAAYFDRDNNKQEITGVNFISDIRNQRIQYKGESLLHDDLKRIAKSVSKDTTSLAFFVTDGIMSFSNQDIARDREKNKAESQNLMNLVTYAFKEYKNVSVSLYQLSSKFTGTYYCYTNIDQATLNASARYFYVIAIGKPEYLADLKQRIAKKSTDALFKFKPKGEWHCIEKKVLNDGFYIEPVGMFAQKGDNFYYEIKNINNNGKTIQFTIADSVFVNYEHSLDSIKNHCNVYLDGKLLKNVVSTTKNALDITINTSDNTLAKNCELKIQVDYFYPAWVKKSSNEDDKYMKTNPDARTFLLEQFASGIFKGVVGDEHHPIYSKTIHLIQK